MMGAGRRLPALCHEQPFSPGSPQNPHGSWPCSPSPASLLFVLSDGEWILSPQGRVPPVPGLGTSRRYWWDGGLVEIHAGHPQGLASQGL